MNPIFAEIGTSVFERMSARARATGAINLGQGFPDDPGPEDIRKAAADAVVNGWNQYPPMLGLPELRTAVADHYLRFQGIALDPEREVMITSGATEALAGALLALIAPGDEVVLFQPMYDAYLPLVLRAGGVPKFVRLKPPRWDFDDDDLAAAFSDRTRVVLFNNPLNPAAVAFDGDSLLKLARFCVRHDAIAVCDEVWEHVVFDGRRHSTLFAVAGMRDRTVKVGSAGKIFSMTGWKVGFVCACERILRVLARAHQFITFTTPPNLQVAVAFGLAKDDAYFAAMRGGLQRSRDRLADGLRSIGWRPFTSQGTYFLNVDVSEFCDNDEAFCNRLVDEYGVATIPVSAFYAADPVFTAIRLCFAKRDSTLDGALERLARVKALA